MGKSTVIIPKKLSLDPKKMAQVLTNTMNSTARAIQTDFNVTVQTWADKPTFAIASPTPSTRAIGTDDPIYTMLNEGTRPHEIAPHGNVLAFRTPFRAKTVPRQIASGPGRNGGNVVFTRKPIHHPGTEAREWDTTIAAKWDRQFAGIMQRAIDAAID
jgi:hypothetical protein